MNDYKKLAKILEKAAPGEGSRGGHIIGHTRSGKPIYHTSSHESHQTFGSQEHTDAMNQHHDIWSKTQQKIANIRTKKPNWNPPKQVHDFLQHHYTQMQMHQNRASSAMDKEARHKKTMVEPSGKIVGPKPFHTPQNIHKGLNDVEVPFMACVVIISPDKKKVLLGKREKDGEWESPAGHADIGEHPEDVAIRECFEEFNVPLKREQLEQLPMMYKKDMTPCHCFMAITEKYQIKNVSCEDDPSEEHTKWKWFKLDDKLPDEMEDNRFNTIIHAKMRLAGITEMQKAMLPLDDMEGMSTISTSDFSQENDSSSKGQALIEQHMLDYKPGDEPRKIPLEDSVLYLVRVDDGMYSGFVKRVDRDGLMETVANLDKMTIPAIVQFLKAKQIIKESPKVEQPSPEDELKRLLKELMPKEEKMIYVSMDGDNIGNRVAQAEARDDEQALMEFSRRINAGQTIFQTWAQSVGGSVIEGGGDEALAKVPESAKPKIEFFRSQYEQVVGATVTVGVGESISHATKARELGKLKGKNRTEVFIPMKSDEELKQLFKPVDEAQKLRDSGVLELAKALRLLKGAALPIGTVRQWGVNKYAKHRDGWVVVGGEHNGKVMGNFLDKPTHEDFARYHSKTSIKEDIQKSLEKSALERAKAADLITLPEDVKGTNCGNCKFVDKSTNQSKLFCKHVSVNQAVTSRMCCKLWDKEGSEREWLEKGNLAMASLFDKLEVFTKSQKLPTGSVRIWSGQKFIKQGDGHWMPMGNSNDEPPKASPSAAQRPTSVQQPQEGIIHNDANSMAVAQPKDSKLPADGAPSSQATEHKEPALKHLMPEKNGGGHVSVHSKDLKTALEQGPISIISAGRNPNIPEDKGMTDEQINKRHKKLEEELKDMGLKFTKVKGQYGGSEDFFMVFNVDPKKMNELGKKYNQDSVIHSEGGKNKLHFTTGEHEGKHHKGSGFQEVPEAKDYYSEIGTTDGKKSKFSLNLDFGKHHQENE